MTEPRKRFFKYDPQEHSTPGSKVGFGDVLPGTTYIVLDDLATLLEHDGDFKELKTRPGKNVEDRTGLAPEEPEVAAPPAETETAPTEPPQAQARERAL